MPNSSVAKPIALSITISAAQMIMAEMLRVTARKLVAIAV